MVCADCYRTRKIAEDAAAPKVANITMRHLSDAPTLAVEINGQVEINKDALISLGYAWETSSEGTFFRLTEPRRKLSRSAVVTSGEHLKAWIADRQTELDALGYVVENKLSVIEMGLFARYWQEHDAKLAAKSDALARLAEIKKAELPPGRSALRSRILEIEKQSRAKWNGTIYGSKGRHHFYVQDVNIPTDAEASEWNGLVQARMDWTKKHKDAIEAAK